MFFGVSATRWSDGCKSGQKDQLCLGEVRGRRTYCVLTHFTCIVKQHIEGDILTMWNLPGLNIALLNPATAFEWCNFFRIPRLVSTVTVYTRSFSFWSIAGIEPTMPTPPLVSAMAVKSMGTNEIRLLGSSEEQMIFLWLITNCKRVCAGHITSESVSPPRFVSSGWAEENKAVVMVFTWVKRPVVKHWHKEEDENLLFWRI